MRFRFKLEGRDRDWHEAGNRRQAFYDDLPPRGYRFRVIASNNDGVWNEAGASFDFSPQRTTRPPGFGLWSSRRFWHCWQLYTG